MKNQESLFCSGCQMPVHDPLLERIELGGERYHLKASCPRCLRYLKFMGQGGPPKLFFGKYKDKEIAEVARKDPDYLRWLAGSPTTKPSLKRMIEEALNASL